MTKSENPPAFPRPAFTSSQNAGDPFPHHEQDGMTLRDYFAGEALPEVISGVPFNQYGFDCPIDAPAYIEAKEKWREIVAAESYLMANAMLVERSKS